MCEEAWKNGPQEEAVQNVCVSVGMHGRWNHPEGEGEGEVDGMAQWKVAAEGRVMQCNGSLAGMVGEMEVPCCSR